VVDDNRGHRELGIEEKTNEESDGGQSLQFRLLLEFFDTGSDFITFPFFFGLSDYPFHQTIVSKRSVVLLALITQEEPLAQLYSNSVCRISFIHTLFKA